MSSSAVAAGHSTASPRCSRVRSRATASKGSAQTATSSRSRLRRRSRRPRPRRSYATLLKERSMSGYAGAAGRHRVGGRRPLSLPGSAPLLRHQAGESAEAAARGRALLDGEPQYAGLFDNVACCESLAGRRADAVEHLRRAIELSERFRSYAKGGSDFDPIRDEPALKELIAE